MIEQGIREFAKQFKYEPEIVNGEKLEKKDVTIVAGMGGSHLCAGLVQTWDPKLDIVIHSDYGIDSIPDSVLEDSLVVASSYSGNTEEVIDVFEQGIKKGLSIVVLSDGGKLLELAKQHEVPYIDIPNTGIQPRLALGYSTKGLLKLMGNVKGLEEISQLAESFDPDSFEEQGKALAEKLQGKIPVVYSSARNQPLAYNWKIKLNESAKIPAFYNVFPELNHNEIEGFGVVDSTKDLSSNIAFIFLKDKEDHSQIQKRMEVTEGMYKDRGLVVENVALEGYTGFDKLFSSLILADWVAWYTAQYYDTLPEKVPMVEGLKKLI